MKVIIIIGLIILGIALIVIVFKDLTTTARIKGAFEHGSVIVYGRKGYGKDILFQYIINQRKKRYFSNLNYGGDYHHIDMTEMELGDNSCHNFISGDIKQVEKNNALEGCDIYLSDSGVYLPSQFDSYLHKVYPSLPISYALSRHLWNNGIHCNAQALGRIWKSLREQADYYVFLRKRCLKLPFFIVLFTTEYHKYESALNELQPMKSTLFNKYSKAEMDLYKAKHGFIKNGLLIVRKSTLKYDTRAFHKIIYGEEAPQKETLWKKLKKCLSKIGQHFKTTCKKSQKRK